MRIAYLGTTLILISVWVAVSFALKCKTGDGPSDEDFKRIARSCMKKVSENNGRRSINLDHHYYDEYNQDDRFRQDNRDRLQMKTRQRRKASNDRRYDQAPSSGRAQILNLRSNENNNHYRENRSNTSYQADWHMDQGQGGACVLHCFFEELGMLKKDDYPDRYKVTYILTKDIRNRELRIFYTDAIHECFQLLESQRRKDQCQFSKDLIQCMSDYARANCDDWQEHTLIFT